MVGGTKTPGWSEPLAKEVITDKTIKMPSIDKKAIAAASIIRRTLLAVFISSG
jgi:hypothetical protein